MAWYNFFLMNVPETFILLALPFVLYGIAIKEKLNRMIVFSLTQGIIIFISSAYLQTAIKPFVTLVSFLLLVFFLFNFKFLKALLITLTTFVFLVLFETVGTLLMIQFFEISYDDFLINPWLRILTSFIVVQIPMILMMFILLKLKFKIRLPAFLKKSIT